MDRLTKRTLNGVAYMAIADTLSKSDQEIEGSKPILEGLYAMFQKLAAYEDAEEAGLLIKLPVAIGQTLYWVRHRTIYVCVVKNVDYYANRVNKIYIDCDTDNSDINFKESDLGKTVFLTREEAEKALEG